MGHPEPRKVPGKGQVCRPANAPLPVSTNVPTNRNPEARRRTFRGGTLAGPERMEGGCSMEVPMLNLVRLLICAAAVLALAAVPGRAQPRVALEPWVWHTPIRWPGPRPHPAVWDPVGLEPGLLALENREGEGCRLVRLALDGSCTPLGEADGPPFSPFATAMAATPDGAVVVPDPHRHRIWRVDRAGRWEPLAGTGGTEFNGDTDADGRPRHALQANLDFPCGIAVTRLGEVVFSDGGHGLIRRINPDGTLETLAGGAPGQRAVRNDLTRRHPATASTLGPVQHVAVAPDGRILFSIEDLQDLPYEYLRQDHAGQGLRARIALHVLDAALAWVAADTDDQADGPQ